MPDYEALILAKQEEIEAGEECSGDCDYCYWKTVVPGTDERIDREPRYYCSLIFEAKENCKDEEKPL